MPRYHPKAKDILAVRPSLSVCGLPRPTLFCVRTCCSITRDSGGLHLGQITLISDSKPVWQFSCKQTTLSHKKKSWIWGGMCKIRGGAMQNHRFVSFLPPMHHIQGETRVQSQAFNQDHSTHGHYCGWERRTWPTHRTTAGNALQPCCEHECVICSKYIPALTLDHCSSKGTGHTLFIIC